MILLICSRVFSTDFGITVNMRVAVLVLIGLIGVASAFEYVSRIVGGNAASTAQYRHAASVLYSFSANSFTHTCGGTIISTTAVLSAASCFIREASQPPSRWRVRIGSVYSNYGGTVIVVHEIVPHDDFNSKTLKNNIAVLRLSDIIVFSNTIQPATLAHTNDELSIYQNVWAIGWGRTQNGVATHSNTLQQIELYVMDSASCPSSPMNREYIVDATTNVCVRYLFGGRGQCDGDEGSPLVVKVDNKVNNNIIVGIFSWTRECSVTFSSVNTRVAPYYDWIIRTTYNLSSDDDTEDTSKQSFIE